MMCRKIIECMCSKPKTLKVIGQPEKIHATHESNLSTLKKESEIPMVKEVKEANEESTQEPVKEGLLKSLGPRIATEPLANKPSGNQLVVENLGMPYFFWSNTVRIDRETLLSLGKTIREVEIETENGKNTLWILCRVTPMEGSKKGVIQISNKMQRALKIRKGDLVRVKPVTSLKDERF